MITVQINNYFAKHATLATAVGGAGLLATSIVLIVFALTTDDNNRSPIDTYPTATPDVSQYEVREYSRDANPMLVYSLE